ncbi:MAG TPA: glycosyltransferase [Blastocatellia bacterium]|nr:glycosyltransferase [Blastocatellia bacterium]
MAAPNLSVVIPTYNRPSILKKALEGYCQQTALNEILEILVVDDGSEQGTGEVVAEVAEASVAPIRYLRQDNRGQAAARNHGIREARGELILLSDDDVIPSPVSIAEHLAWHTEHPDPKVGVVGSVPYSPEVHPTPFQQWWGLDGVRYHPPCLFPGQGVAFRMIQFCNTSLKAEFLDEVGMFDENFRTFGYEDNEFAYRLAKAGGKVYFNPAAVGYHYKRVTFSDACRSVQKSAASRRYLATTEAGVKLAEADEMQAKSRREQIKTLVTRCVVPVLSPLRPLLDSQLPLPGRLYGAFYHYYIELKSEPLRRRNA